MRAHAVKKGEVLSPPGGRLDDDNDPSSPTGTSWTAWRCGSSWRPGRPSEYHTASVSLLRTGDGKKMPGDCVFRVMQVRGALQVSRGYQAHR